MQCGTAALCQEEVCSAVYLTCKAAQATNSKQSSHAHYLESATTAPAPAVVAAVAAGKTRWYICRAVLDCVDAVKQFLRSYIH